MQPFEKLMFASAKLGGEDEPPAVLCCAYNSEALARKLEEFIALNFTVTPQVRKNLRARINAVKEWQGEVQLEIPGEGWFEFTVQFGCGSFLYET